MSSKYTYESVTGHIEIEISGEWAAILAAEDKAELNNERRHRRYDHKYAPGEPLSIQSLQYEGEWIADADEGIRMVEASADLDRALMALTELQRRYFTMNRLEGYSYTEIARLEGKNESTVRRLTESAAERVKKISYQLCRIRAFPRLYGEGK